MSPFRGASTIGKERLNAKLAERLEIRGSRRDHGIVVGAWKRGEMGKGELEVQKKIQETTQRNRCNSRGLSLFLKNFFCPVTFDRFPWNLHEFTLFKRQYWQE